MSENPKSFEVILLDKKEMEADKSGSFMTIWNLDGTTYKIGAKRQHLWAIFTKAHKGTPFLLTFETFTTPKNEQITYVSDAKAITEDLLLQAGLKTKLTRLLTSSDNERVRSQAVAYAKDLAMNKVVEVGEVLNWATTFFGFIKGLPEVKPDLAEEKVDEAATIASSESHGQHGGKE